MLTHAVATNPLHAAWLRILDPEGHPIDDVVEADSAEGWLVQLQRDAGGRLIVAYEPRSDRHEVQRRRIERPCVIEFVRNATERVRAEILAEAGQ